MFDQELLDEERKKKKRLVLLTLFLILGLVAAIPVLQPSDVSPTTVAEAITATAVDRSTRTGERFTATLKPPTATVTLDRSQFSSTPALTTTTDLTSIPDSTSAGDTRLDDGDARSGEPSRQAPSGRDQSETGDDEDSGASDTTGDDDAETLRAQAQTTPNPDRTKTGNADNGASTATGVVETPHAQTGQPADVTPAATATSAAVRPEVAVTGEAADLFTPEPTTGASTGAAGDNATGTDDAEAFSGAGGDRVADAPRSTSSELEKSISGTALDDDPAGDEEPGADDAAPANASEESVTEVSPPGGLPVTGRMFATQRGLNWRLAGLGGGMVLLLLGTGLAALRRSGP